MNTLVYIFCLPIALRIGRRGTTIHDSVMYLHLSDIVVHKWSAIVIDDLVEYAKLCNDGLTNEVCYKVLKKNHG
jgi:hypothetical protein